VWSLAFEPQGKKSATTPSNRFVSCGGDSKLILWSKEKDGEQWIKACDVGTPHDRPIYAVSWSAAGLIASAGGDDQICVYREDENDSSTFLLEESIESAHLSDINSVEWNVTNSLELASGGDDFLVKIWEYA
jgi:WD40 repeat protein